MMRYGIVTLIISLFGSLAFAAIVKLENVKTEDLSYWDVVWDFLLSPFGLCSTNFAKSFPMKIFTLSWLTIWFLMAGFFWAELSSNMTVDKLTRDIESLEDVLMAKSEYFWLNDMKRMSFKIVKDLGEKYDTFKNHEHISYEKLASSTNLKHKTQALLEKSQILITWYTDLNIQLSDEIKNSHQLVIKQDWSVPVHFHYFTKKTNTKVLDALNEYLYISQENGDIAKGFSKWLQFNVTHTLVERGERSIGTMFESLGPLKIVLVAVFGGSGLSLLTSLLRLCWMMQKARILHRS